MDHDSADLATSGVPNDALPNVCVCVRMWRYRYSSQHSHPWIDMEYSVCKKRVVYISMHVYIYIYVHNMYIYIYYILYVCMYVCMYIYIYIFIHVLIKNQHSLGWYCRFVPWGWSQSDCLASELAMQQKQQGLSYPNQWGGSTWHPARPRGSGNDFAQHREYILVKERSISFTNWIYHGMTM